MPPKPQGVTRTAGSLDEAGGALHQLLVRAFGRLPTDREMDTLGASLANGVDAHEFLRQLTRLPAYRANPQTGSKAPAGHFYSPVVAPETVRDYVAMNRNAGLDGLKGIEFPLEAMASFWHGNAAFIASCPFRDAPDGVHRYSYGDGPYRDGDGVMLRTMIHHFRPRRIIEIGSGYSTACMLDTMDELGMADVALTCVEPNPRNLFSILREGDRDRISIHQNNVQDMPLDAFRSLQANDIVFIDSSHVLKTGSDVHYELFYILPNLAPGVIVHFHDCRFPLEYSDRQIFVKNYSWNEVYAVRALLMYSTRFKVLFHGSLFLQHFPDLAAASAAFQRNPGAALWLEVARPECPLRPKPPS
jgi:predicted O-methyltransferase YrrM